MAEQPSSRGGVRAETRMVPPGHGLRYWPPNEPWDSDALNHDLANDEHVTATFDDLYGLPDPPPHRRVRAVRPPVPTNVAADPSSAASTHRAAPDTHPSPECSARAVSPKETHV